MSSKNEAPCAARYSNNACAPWPSCCSLGAAASACHSAQLRRVTRAMGVLRTGEAPADLDGCSRAHSARPERQDRKSTRLNSSHLGISYAVFCLKKKKKKKNTT